LILLDLRNQHTDTKTDGKPTAQELHPKATGGAPRYHVPDCFTQQLEEKFVEKSDGTVSEGFTPNVAVFKHKHHVDSDKKPVVSLLFSLYFSNHLFTTSISFLYVLTSIENLSLFFFFFLQKFMLNHRDIESRGEDFETKLDKTDCPAGYYCPNKTPPFCSTDECPEADIKNYYTPNTCATTPRGGNPTPNVNCAAANANSDTCEAANTPNDKCVFTSADAILQIK